MRVVDDLRNGLFSLMQQAPKLSVIGEDIVDPYGGAFKVTKGLHDAFPDRVRAMPISESSIVGFGLGMSLRGHPVIAEIMFGDFLTLTLDQLLNHAAKVEWMFDGAVKAPLIIRTPMGGGRGYGPTHSQSIEKHFCGIPGLTVFAVNQFASPAELLKQAFALQSPVLFIENKITYSKLVETERLVSHASPDVVLLTYGGVSEICVKSAERLLKDEEISVNVIPLEQLSPFPAEQVRRAVSNCDRVVVVEEGTEEWGFAAACAESLLAGGMRPNRFKSIAAPSMPIPSAKDWEVSILPNVDRVSNEILSLF
ncbi:MAG: transketolase C-terminal domain-containing protein [Stappiaceae bacterium]